MFETTLKASIAKTQGKVKFLMKIVVKPSINKAVGLYNAACAVAPVEIIKASNAGKTACTTDETLSTALNADETSE